jgi:hypothetical protein
MMSRKPMGENMGLDMPFGEAMERFIGVKPREMEANIAKSKKKKRSPPGKKAKSGNVILLKDRKTSLRRRGLA